MSVSSPHKSSPQATLFLRLEGPMQSWGGRTIGRFRRTELAPTKSGILGLLGNALGLTRLAMNARLEEWNKLTMAVRVDRAGRLEEDYQTVGAKVGVIAANGEIKKTAATKEVEAIISPREFLVDASFLVILRGDANLIFELAEHVKSPRRPLFLGRKRCVPGTAIYAGVVSGCSLVEALLQDGPEDDSQVSPDERADLRVITDLLSLDEFCQLIGARGNEAAEAYEESRSYITDRLMRLEPPVHGGRIVLDFTMQRLPSQKLVDRVDLTDFFFSVESPSGLTSEVKTQAAKKQARDKSTGLCAFCHFKPDDPTRLHAHHRTYLRRGREYVSRNAESVEGDDLVMLCEECHGAVTLLEYQNGFGLTRIDPLNPAWRSRIHQAREARRSQHDPAYAMVGSMLSTRPSTANCLFETTIWLKAGTTISADAPGNRWLTNRQHVHQRLSMAFPEDSPAFAAAGYGVKRDEGSFLFRIEQGPVARIVVRSCIEPDWGRAFRDATWLVDRIPNVVVHEIEQFKADTEWNFELEANPVKRLAVDGPNGRKGQRVVLRAEAELRDWLVRHCKGVEFVAGSLTIESLGRQTARLKNAAQRCWDAVEFCGRLRITDSSEFVAVLRSGIGSAKAFGFGLLSIARVAP